MSNMTDLCFSSSKYSKTEILTGAWPRTPLGSLFDAPPLGELMTS